MRQIAVVVVAHNSGPLLVECVARALANADCSELAIVDNASRDDAVTRAREFKDARLYIDAMPDNAGFAVACNRGAAITTSPWLLFLNPDALLAPDTLSRLLQIAHANPTIGLIGADVRAPDGSREAAARRRDPNLSRMLATQFARLPGGGKFAAHGMEMAAREEPLSDVDAVSGALMLMPRALFERVGGFDESFFLHAEDLDLCRRVRATGARVVVANNVPVTHAQGSSSRSRPFFVVWHKHRSLWRYFTKHEGVRAFTPRGAALLLLLGLRIAAQSAARVFRRR